MDEEREMVLRMLKEGKISVEEADALLQELVDGQPEKRESYAEEPVHAAPAAAGDVRDELRTVFQDLMESFRRDVVPELRRSKEFIRPTLREVLRGLHGLVEGRAETSAEEPMSTGEVLALRNAWGDVQVTTAPGNKMRLRAVKRVWAATAEAAQREAESLPVEARRTGATVEVVTPRHEMGRRFRVDLEVAVPEGVAARTDVAKGDVRMSGVAGAEVYVARGDVQLTDLQGRAEVVVASGDVTLRGIRGDAHLDVKSGDVDIVEIDGNVSGRIFNGDVDGTAWGGVSLDLFNGDLTLSRVSGDVVVEVKHGDLDLSGLQGQTTRVRALSGDVSIAVQKLAEGGTFTAETMSGDIEVIVPTDARATIDAAAMSGEVTCRLPLIEPDRDQGAFRRQTLRGVLNGPGASVMVRTARGDIEIRGGPDG